MTDDLVPLAQVTTTFPSSPRNEYEFSFHARLNDDGLSYDFEEELFRGSDQIWGDLLATYPSWGLPFAQELTWNELVTAHVPNVTSEWIGIDYVQGTSDWVINGGSWDGDTGTYAFDDVDINTNYAINPTFATATTGYTPTATSGGTPVLAVVEYSEVFQLAESLPGPEVTNLILDGNKGTFDDAVIDGFDAGTGIVLASESSQVRSGNGSLSVTWGTTANVGVGTDITGLGVGKQYNLSAWIYVPSGSESLAPSVRVGTDDGDPVVTPDVWTLSEVTFTAATTSITAYGLFSVPGGASMTAYVDDVQLFEVVPEPLEVNPLDVDIASTSDSMAMGMQVTIPVASVAPKITFTVTGLTVGTDYEAGLRARLADQQTLSLSVQGGLFTSLGIVGNEFGDWQTDSVFFTAAATTETITILFSNPAYPTTVALIDNVMVGFPDVDYFDGDIVDDGQYFYEWTGTPNASRSIRIPYGTFMSPSPQNYEEYQSGWTIARLNDDPLRVVIGAVDEDGVELIDQTRVVVSGTTVSAPGFDDVVFGDLGETVTGTNVVTILLPPVDTTDRAPGWRTYIKVAGPGARLRLQSYYHVIKLPDFVPYSIGVSARVLSSTGSVILESDNLGLVSVINWTELRWRFTLPSGVSANRIEILPEDGIPGATTAWQIDAAMLETAPFQEGRLPYLDGTVPVPAVAVPGWLAPEDIGPYDTASDDAIIKWVGTPHASVSWFIGPTQVTLVRDTVLPSPTGDLALELLPDCEPINMTDPVMPSLSAWFTLQSISGLEYASRSESFAIIGRQSPISITQVRSSAAGSIVLILKTLERRQSLLDLMSSGRVLLLRNPDTSYPENNIYLSIGSVQEERFMPDHRMPHRRITFDFQIVDRPSGLIAKVHAPTWEDVANVYTSWGPRLAPLSVIANVASWEELITKMPKIDNPTELGQYAL